MAVAATKKSTRPLDTLAAEHAKRPSGALKVGIAEVFHLEGDYALVKMHADLARISARAGGVKQTTVTALLDKALPQIPGRKVKQLLNKYANRVAAGTTKVSLPAAPPRSASSMGNKFMENMIQAEMAARVERIDSGELITAAELGERLSMSKQAVSRAATTGRMFTVEAPSGKKVFPAFYADPQLDRAVLERISKELGQLPGPSKWQFFTTGKVSLDGKSPLEAISDGQVDKVLAAASAFREH